MNYIFSLALLLSLLNDIFDLLPSTNNEVHSSFIPQLPPKAPTELIFIRAVPDEEPIRCISCTLFQLLDSSSKPVAMALLLGLFTAFTAFFYFFGRAFKKMKLVHQNKFAAYTSTTIDDFLVMRNISINYEQVNKKKPAPKPLNKDKDAKKYLVDLTVLFPQVDSVSAAQNETNDCHQQPGESSDFKTSPSNPAKAAGCDCVSATRYEVNDCGRKQYQQQQHHHHQKQRREPNSFKGYAIDVKELFYQQPEGPEELDDHLIREPDDVKLQGEEENIKGDDNHHKEDENIKRDVNQHEEEKNIKRDDNQQEPSELRNLESNNQDSIDDTTCSLKYSFKSLMARKESAVQDSDASMDMIDQQHRLYTVEELNEAVTEPPENSVKFQDEQLIKLYDDPIVSAEREHCDPSPELEQCESTEIACDSSTKAACDSIKSSFDSIETTSGSIETPPCDSTKIPSESIKTSPPQLQPQTLIRMSYADAVGYDFMEVKRPRHPQLFTGYDVGIAELFHECIEEPVVSSPPSTSNVNSIVDAVAIHSNRRMSYADAVGYDFMEVKRPRRIQLFAGYDCDVSDLFKEPESHQVQNDPSLHSKKKDDLITDSVSTRNDPETPKALNIVTPPPQIERRMSYADAVGYAFTEIKSPCKQQVEPIKAAPQAELNSNSLEMPSKSQDPKIQNNNQTFYDVPKPQVIPNITQIPHANLASPRRMSYSEAVEAKADDIQIPSEPKGIIGQPATEEARNHPSLNKKLSLLINIIEALIRNARLGVKLTNSHLNLRRKRRFNHQICAGRQSSTSSSNKHYHYISHNPCLDF